jgi:MarR family transcriptional regulator, multiple gene regulator MgrA
MSPTTSSNKIEQTIQTQNFLDRRHKALMGLVLLSHQINEKRHDILKPYNITSQQYNVLRILRGQHSKPLTMQDIRARMLDKMSDVTRLVERLFKMGLVKRDINPQDKRVVYVGITQEGLNLLMLIDPHIKDVWELPKLNDQEVEKLIELVEKLLD